MNFQTNLARFVMYSLRYSARVAWVFFWLIPLAAYLQRPEIIQFLYLEDKHIPVSVVWSILIFAMWVAIGDTSIYHKTQFRPYRSVWVSFLLVVLTLFLTFYMSYHHVDNRAQALRSDVALLTRIISTDASDSKPYPSLIDLAKKAITDTEQLSITLDSSGNSISITDTLQDLQEDIHQLTNLTSLAYQTTLNLTSRNRISETKGISFQPLQPIMTELVTTTQLISQTFGALKSSDRISITNIDKLLLQKQIGGELLGYFKQAYLLIESAKDAVNAGEISSANQFILIGILYTLFLLFPWLLLFLFLFRNLEFQVNSKQEILEELGLSKRYKAKSKEEGYIEKDGNPTDLKQVIINQAFRNSEYVVSLLLFTTITAIMWRFVLYPVGWSGLAQRIVQGESVKELTAYLLGETSALTFGFLGAYFFVVQMLFRRYLAADLNPKPYVHATVRMTVVFVLSMVLSITEWGGFYLVAFLAGIFPMAMLQGIIESVTARLPWFKNLDVVRGSLTGLDGIDIWHEARLMEEGVENIQNLAMADLDELIVHTNFCPAELVHWVDQALLYIQVDDKWRGSQGYLHKAGVQTATDLCDAEADSLSKMVIAISAVVRQSEQKDVAQPLTLSEIEAIVLTTQKALKGMPNFLDVKAFWAWRSSKTHTLEQVQKDGAIIGSSNKSAALLPVI